jgi:hypothetical protein
MCRHATSTPHADPPAADDRGVALVMTMLLAGLLTALGLALTMLTTVETWLSAGQRSSQDLSYAADAGIGRAQVDLAAAEWTAVLRSGGAIGSTFDDGKSTVILADGTPIDLGGETRALQTDTDARCGSRATSPDCPAWHLFAHAPAADLVPGRVVDTPMYLAAWIADDPFDGDGDSGADANGRLLVRAQAFGPRGARRSVEAVIGRVGPAAIQLVSWKELR